MIDIRMFKVWKTLLWKCCCWKWRRSVKFRQWEDGENDSDMDLSSIWTGPKLQKEIFAKWCFRGQSPKSKAPGLISALRICILPEFVTSIRDVLHSSSQFSRFSIWSALFSKIKINLAEEQGDLLSLNFHLSYSLKIFESKIVNEVSFRRKLKYFPPK